MNHSIKDIERDAVRNYSQVPFDEAIADVTGGNPKVLTSNLSQSGRYPVIDQGQNLVAGYVDDPELLCRRDQDGLILFGDHTKILKFVDFDFVLGADGVKVLAAKPNFFPRYIFHYLNSVRLPNNAGYSRHFKFLKSVTVPKPSLDDQRRIASILDKADAIRRKRQESLRLCDEFLKSVFLEMFGDPVRNEKGWGGSCLAQHTSKIGSGSTPTGGDSSYKTTGISLIRSLNVRDGKFSYKNLAYIDEAQAQKLSGVVVEENDILLNITGASVARVCRAPKSVLPARVNQHVLIIRTVKNLSPYFLEKLFLSPSMKRKLLKISGSGATREAITKSEIEKLEIIIPPENLQKNFSEIVCSIEKLKEKVVHSLDKSDELFKSFAQRAFRGKL